MRKITLVLILLPFLTSCRNNSETSNIDSTQVTPQMNTQVEIQPAISSTFPPIDETGINSRVGIAGVFGTTYEEGKLDESGKYEHGKFDESGEFLCLTTQNSTLKSGDKIQIIDAKMPQRVFRAEVSED